MMANPIQSKKLAAFLVAEITWKILAVLVLFWGKDSIPNQVWAILMAIVVVAGFVEVGYIIGQASLDKYIQIAKIAVGAGHSVTMKGITINKATEDKPVENKTPEEKK
jgi:hypothetical protein